MVVTGIFLRSGKTANREATVSKVVFSCTAAPLKTSIATRLPVPNEKQIIVETKKYFSFSTGKSIEIFANVALSVQKARKAVQMMLMCWRANV